MSFKSQIGKIDSTWLKSVGQNRLDSTQVSRQETLISIWKIFQDEFRMNCTLLQTILNQYDPPGQIMVFLGVVMIIINVISSMVWMAMYYDNIFYTIIGSSVVFMNAMLMIGIVYHRREFLIIFLWYSVLLKKNFFSKGLTWP